MHIPNGSPFNFFFDTDQTTDRVDQHGDTRFESKKLPFSTYRCHEALSIGGVRHGSWSAIV